MICINYAPLTCPAIRNQFPNMFITVMKENSDVMYLHMYIAWGGAGISDTQISMMIHLLNIISMLLILDFY